MTDRSGYHMRDMMERIPEHEDDSDEELCAQVHRGAGELLRVMNEDMKLDAQTAELVLLGVWSAMTAIGMVVEDAPTTRDEALARLRVIARDMLDQSLEFYTDAKRRKLN